MLLTTPNFGGLSRRLLGMRWRVVDPEHLGYFTAATLRRALERAGFTRVSVQPRTLDVTTWRSALRGKEPSRFDPHSAAAARDRVDRLEVALDGQGLRQRAAARDARSATRCWPGRCVREGAFKTWLFRAATGLHLPAIAATWVRGVPILAYHGVTASPSSPFGNLRRLHVPAPRFEEHLRVLSTECRPIALRELVEAIETGKSLPARSVVVTFDDGYRNVFTTALPLLRKYSVPATLFVVTHNGGRMWEDDVEVAVELAAAESARCNGAVYRVHSLDDKRRALAAILPALQRLGPARAGGTRTAGRGARERRAFRRMTIAIFSIGRSSTRCERREWRSARMPIDMIR